MIKIKVLNPIKYRNEPTFRPLWFIKDKLRDYSIDLTESDDYDKLCMYWYNIFKNLNNIIKE